MMVSSNGVWQNIIKFGDVCGLLALTGAFLICVLITIELYLIIKEGD